MANVNIKRGNAKPQKTVIQEINMVSPDRTPKDAGKLINAIKRAESIHAPSRVQLYDIYNHILTLDGTLGGIVDKRNKAVTNKTLQFIGRDGKKVDELDDLIKSKKFRELVELRMNKIYWGLSGVEFLIGEKFDYNVIPRKHININNRTILKSQFDYNGTSFDDLPFVIVWGDKNDYGKFLQCALYALYKRSGFGDFAQFVEIFGQPVRIIYYDAYDSKTRGELRDLLNTSGSSLALMIPKQAEFQMMDGKTSNATGELQMNLIAACNDEMKISILGNTETTSSSKSSGYAQAQEHGEQQLEITKSDLKDVLDDLNEEHFLKILSSYGYPVEGGKFEFVKELDLEKLTKRLGIDKEVSQKVPYSDDYWYETYGIPKPDNYDELKAKQEEQRQTTLQAMQQAGKQSAQSGGGNNKPTAQDKKNLADHILSFFGLAPREQSEQSDGALDW